MHTTSWACGAEMQGATCMRQARRPDYHRETAHLADVFWAVLEQPFEGEEFVRDSLDGVEAVNAEKHAPAAKLQRRTAPSFSSTTRAWQSVLGPLITFS